nr:hypothetical protein [Paenibacillus xylanexedens]
MDRKKHADTTLKFDKLADEEPIFLSTRGTKYTYSAFYNNWSKIIRNADIKLNPHKARHWFVTSRLKGIYETSNSQAEIEEKKKQLIGYMKWRDAETIDVYEHIYDEEKYRDLHESLIRTYSIREKEYLQNKKRRKEPRVNKTATNQDVDFKEDWLNDLFEGMD